MIHESRAAADVGNDFLAVGGEARSGVDTGGAFAGVVWCWCRDDDFCAFCDEGFGCVGEVGHVGLDDCSVRSHACFRA